MVISYLLLAVGASLALVLIVLHALRHEGGRVAAVFFGSAVVYGCLRHAGVWWVTESFHDSAFPYQFVRSPIRVLGVSPIEIGGWVLVAYLGWQLGRGFVESGNVCQLSLAAFLLIASASYAVETAAMAAHWWFWRLPLETGIFGKVPLIGIIDWGFVGIDFVLPFALWYERRAASPAFWASTLLFPAHMLAHTQYEYLWVLPFSISDLFHYLTLSGLFLAGALLPSRPQGGQVRDRLLLGAPLTVVAVLVAVEGGILGEWALVASALPFSLFALVAAVPRTWWLGLLALPFAWQVPTLVPSAFPAALWGLWRSRRRWVAGLAVAAFWLLLAGWFGHKQRQEKAWERAYVAANEAYRGSRFAEAEGLIRQAIEAAPSHPESLYHLGTILRAQGRWREAAEAYRQSLDTLEFNEMAAKMLVAALLVAGRPDEARADVSRLLSVHPDEPSLLYVAGNVEERLKNRREAIRYWIEAISPGEKTIDTLVKIEALRQLGHEVQAEREAHDALRRVPEDQDVALWLEQRYLERGAPDQALAMYDYLARNGRLKAYVLKVGELALRVGRPDIAQVAYESVLRKEPGDAAARAGLQRARALMGNAPAARHDGPGL